MALIKDIIYILAIQHIIWYDVKRKASARKEVSKPEAFGLIYSSFFLPIEYVCVFWFKYSIAVINHTGQTLGVILNIKEFNGAIILTVELLTSTISPTWSKTMEFNIIMINSIFYGLK